MIRCEEFLAQVSELIDREMAESRDISWDASWDASWYQAMKAHAEQCRDCYVIYETTRQTIRLVGDESLFELPPEVSRRLHAALDQKMEADLTRQAQPASEARRHEPGQQQPTAGPVLDLPWTPPASPRPWWRSGGLAFAAALLLLAAITGVHWMRRQTVYVAGWLSDAHCYTTYRIHPERHPRTCMLAGWCQQSGFGVIDARGNFVPFDKGATDRVVTLLEANASPDHIWVQADGRKRDGVLQVKDIELRTPDQRLAKVDQPLSSLLQDVSTIIAPAGWH